MVKTKGNESFWLDIEYVLYVKAEDHSGSDRNNWQSTPEEKLSIMGGKRPPQFYMASYNAEIPESLQIESEVLKVKAKSFADHEIR